MNFIILGITLINPFIGFLMALLGIYGDRKHWRTYIFCMSLFFANLSYCYTPESVHPDLYRYFEYIFRLRGRSLAETVSYGYQGTKLYVFSFFVWIANLFQDEHLVPFFSVLLVYYIAFYCTCFMGEREKIKWKFVCTYLVFQMMTLDWYSLTNNVRNVAAFAVIGFAIFRDTYVGKKDLLTLICYVAPIFVHPTSLIFVLVRIVLAFIKTNKMRVILLAVTILINLIVELLEKNINLITDNYVIQYLIRKAYNYLFDTNSAYGLAVQASLRSSITRILYLTLAVLFVLMFFVLLYNKTKNRREVAFQNVLEKYQTFIMVLALMALACSTMLRPEYWRFTAALIIFGSGIVLLFMGLPRNIISQLLKNLFLVLTVMCFFIWGYQFSYFNYKKLIVDMMLNSPIIVAIQHLIRL
ncbi:MAG: hypothetical protein HFI67_11925 [Lachnospiraceae bacterium]|jgi:hypothetical protein|nr:hypothetical protein [Lachnospiraceae bacterium]